MSTSSSLWIKAPTAERFRSILRQEKHMLRTFFLPRDGFVYLEVVLWPVPRDNAADPMPPVCRPIMHVQREILAEDELVRFLDCVVQPFEIHITPEQCLEIYFASNKGSAEERRELEKRLVKDSSREPVFSSPKKAQPS